MANSSELNRRVAELTGARDHLLREQAEVSSRKEWADTLALQLERAQLIIQAAAKATQEQLSYRISELTSLALAQVFVDPYELVVRFENKRGRTEAVLLFADGNGNEIDPMEASGGGVWDVASLALRLSLWSLQRPRSRATMVLDEPFKFLHGEVPQCRVCKMIQNLSRRLKLQFIIVTQEEWGTEFADRVFRVSRKSKKVPSVVKVEG